MLELWDSFFRFGGIASCLFAAVLIYRDGRCTLSGKLGIICCVNVALWLFIYTPNLYQTIGPVMLSLTMLCQIGPVVTWLFCLSLFDDAFEIRPQHYVFGVLFLASEIMLHFVVLNSTGELLLKAPSGSYAKIGEAGPASVMMGLIVQMLKLAIAVHLCYAAWSGRNDDLVEARRRFRSVFVMFVGMSFAWMVAVESYMLGHGAGNAVQLFLATQSASVFFIVGYMLWHLTNLKGEWLFGEPDQPLVVQQSRSLSEDRHDLEMLKQMVSQDALYEQGLTISRLAEAANMPEHRLRRIINQHLGYRNFADYLNHHRIEAAKARLAVLDDRHVPILTMAMDLGYGSLGPFNRAFKERSGMTPTEYRKKILADM